MVHFIFSYEIFCLECEVIKNYAFVHVDVEDNGDAIIRELSGTDLKGELKNCYDLYIFIKQVVCIILESEGFERQRFFLIKN